MSSKLTMRGVSQQRQVLVMLDGMPLNDKNSGNVDWNAIPVDVVDRIEVVRGTASSLYGTNAVAGVINIITKDVDKQQIKLKAGYGSYGTYRWSVNIAQPIGKKFSVNGGFNKEDSHGYITQKFAANKAKKTSNKGTKVTGYERVPNKKGEPSYIYGDGGKNTFTQNNWQVGMQYKFEESKKLSFKMLHNNYKYHSGTDPHTYLYDAAGNSVWSGTVNLAGTSVSLGTYGKNGSKFFSPYYGGKEHSTYALSYNDEDNNLKISAGINDIKDNWYVSGSGGLLTESPSKSWNISVQKEIFNTEHDKLVVGVDYLFGKTDSADTNLTNWRDRNSKKDVKAFASGKEKTVAAYFENQHRFDDKWKFVLGGRYDSWKNYEGASRYYDKGKLVSDPVLESKRKTMFSPKVALQFKPDEDTSYHVSWGRSFRAPNIFELYKAAPGGTSVTSTYKDSNPDLNPETVDAIEFGIKKQFNNSKTSISATYFHSDIEDMIYTMDTGKKYHLDALGIDLKWTKPVNAAKGKVDGVEFEIDHQLSDTWDVFVNYTYQNSRITDNPLDRKNEGKQMAYVPKYLFNGGISYHKNKWSGSLVGNYTSKVYSNADHSDYMTGYYGCNDPYFVLNLSTHYQLDKNTCFNLDVNNILNREYYTYYTAPGRNYFFSVERKF